MAAPADEAPSFDNDLRKAFQDLQTKAVMTNKQMQLAEAQILQINRNVNRAKLTLKEFSEYPEETRTYQQVGRMFMLQPLNEVREDLEAKVVDGGKKIEAIEENKQHLQKALKEQENNIREMVSNRK